jgi:hypothetical protein
MYIIYSINVSSQRAAPFQAVYKNYTYISAVQGTPYGCDEWVVVSYKYYSSFRIRSTQHRLHTNPANTHKAAMTVYASGFISIFPLHGISIYISLSPSYTLKFSFAANCIAPLLKVVCSVKE